MNVKLLLLVGALCVAVTAGEVFGMTWGDGKHRRGNGNGSSVSASSSGGSGGSGYSVPEPSTLYGIASALALLGGAGWMLRRK